jgi:hypothetical protein
MHDPSEQNNGHDERVSSTADSPNETIHSQPYEAHSAADSFDEMHKVESRHLTHFVHDNDDEASVTLSISAEYI